MNSVNEKINPNGKSVEVTSEQDPYAQMAKNTVDAKGQLAPSKYVRFDFPEGKGVRVMFVGNSITIHGVLESIGWFNEWGMAASAKEKDYVHLLQANIREIAPEAAFCICQVANWEREYKQADAVLPLFASARNFEADVIVLRFIENVPKNGYDSDIFLSSLDTLVKYLNPTGKAKLLITTGFWRHPGDKDIRAYAEREGIPCVELGDLGEDSRMKAIGLFAHEGVANHPGDLGMQRIAERIADTLAQML